MQYLYFTTGSEVKPAAAWKMQKFNQKIKWINVLSNVVRV